MRGKFTLFLLVPQAIFIVLFGVFVDYDTEVGGASNAANEHSQREFDNLYPMFQDVHVMIFVGFGFLMTFLKRYGYGSVSFNLMLSALVIQWAILMRGVLDTEGLADGKIHINLESILNADFACGAVLISFGAVLGVLSPIQLVVMAILEVVFYAVNEYVIVGVYGISDIGGSLVIHAFGAYFGLAVSITHWRKALKENSKEGSLYHSDILAMIGTLFLWLYWPSFNAAPAAGTFPGLRAVITTIYSLSGAAVTSFAISSLVDKSGKLSMIHIQNATLAGGVAVGSVANLRLGPLGSVAVGSLSGALSVMGYTYVTPALQKLMKLHDTCGVHNLHGMPGVLSAIVAVILARYSAADTFHHSELESIYPKITLTYNATHEVFAVAEDGYSFTQQANMQMAGLATTLGISIAGGLLTGLLLKIPILSPTKNQSLFDDADYWLLEDDEDVRKGEIPMVVLEVPRSDEVKSKQDFEDKASGSSTQETTALAT